MSCIKTLAMAALIPLFALRPAMAEHNYASARAFVQEAFSSGTVEIQLAQLALKTTTSPEVTDFAGLMIGAHRNANERLEEVADDLGIAVIIPDTASDTLLHELQALDGPAFNRAYMAAMVERHQDAVALYTQALGSLPEGQLREYAKATLPILQDHLSAANYLKKALRTRRSAR